MQYMGLCRNDFRLVVIYDMNTIGNDGFEDKHTHEEADTIVPHQVLASVAGDYVRELCVWSLDTYVPLLLLRLVCWSKLGPHTSRNFLNGKCLKHREIDVVEGCALLSGHWVRWEFCQDLKGVGGCLHEIRRNKAVISCLQELGNGTLQKELVHNELRPDVSLLESFVCDVYYSTGSRTIPTLRWVVFRTRNLQGEKLPPTCVALLPYLCKLRHHAWQMICGQKPALLSIDLNGWYMENGVYMPVCCLTLPRPRAVLELKKMGLQTWMQRKVLLH